MKASTLATVALSAVTALAAPTKTLGKRAAITDSPDIGFATLNGGTTGGAGGTTTTVSSLAQFSAAAEADGAAVIVVSGAISGSAKIRVASDKTIIGKDSSAVLTNIGLYINKVKNVIVRNLRSLEALGAVTDICSDKTGTLTQGKMVAKKAWIPCIGTFSVGEIDEPFNPTKGAMFLGDLIKISEP